MLKHRKKVLFLFIVLFLFTCSAGAQEGLLWPFERDLLCKDWSNIEPQSWVKVGDVRIWNTRWDLKIDIKPLDGFKLKEVIIFVLICFAIMVFAASSLALGAADVLPSFSVYYTSLIVLVGFAANSFILFLRVPRE